MELVGAMMDTMIDHLEIRILICVVRNVIALVTPDLILAGTTVYLEAVTPPSHT